jgi:hypothetical protein
VQSLARKQPRYFRKSLAEKDFGTNSASVLTKRFRPFVTITGIEADPNSSKTCRQMPQGNHGGFALVNTKIAEIFFAPPATAAKIAVLSAQLVAP